MKRFNSVLLAPTLLLALLFSSCESDDGELIQLNCSTASTSGTIIQGSPATNVIVNVSYTSDGEGSYESQTIQSTGVLGLTATIPAGNFSDGSGTLSYTISGTPQNSGVASFAISVGGVTCSFNIQSYPSGINNSLASCGAFNVHNPDKLYGILTDQQGNVYKTILVGGQEWMAENLKTSIYRNGEPIENVTDSIQWVNATTGAWCYFNNNSQFDCPYGKLYNWFAVDDSRKLCPTGWHVPSDDEWSLLIDYLDPNAAGGDDDNSAGGDIKSAGLYYWTSPNLGANNESGLSGLPAGGRSGLGEFVNLGLASQWWSSSEFSSNFSWSRFVFVDNDDIQRVNITPKILGFSVRCIRD